MCASRSVCVILYPFKYDIRSLHTVCLCLSIDNRQSQTACSIIISNGGYHAKMPQSPLTRFRTVVHT